MILLSIAALLSLIPSSLAGECVHTEYNGNGVVVASGAGNYKETICTTSNAEFDAPCKSTGAFGYCHGLQIDPCSSSEPNGYDNNAGNEPDGVTRSCEQFQTGLSHVVCCRAAPQCDNKAIQCTALKDPSGPAVQSNCITPGPMKIMDGDEEQRDDLDRDDRVFVTYPFSSTGQKKPQNDTTASWSYAAEVCSNLDGGDQGWRLCRETEINSGACCKASSGVGQCEFADADVWVQEMCDGQTTCEVVEEFQYIKGSNSHDRGDKIFDNMVKVFCELETESQFTSARKHLCAWSTDSNNIVRCDPKAQQMLLGDNSGRFGYWIIRKNSSVDTFASTMSALSASEGFEYALLNQNESPSEGLTFLLVNVSNSTYIEAYAVCETGVGYRQCVYENIALGPTTTMSDWEECTTETADDDTGRRLNERAERAERAATENTASVYSPATFIYVVDTGVRASHKMFNGRVLAGHDVWEDQPGAMGSGDTDSGHGTHVAGTAAGGLYKNGVPLGTSQHSFIIPVQLFNANGDAGLDQFHAALTWIYADMKQREGRFVINLSLCKPDQKNEGTNDKTKRGDVEALIADISNNQGIIVSAACNDGEPVDRNMFGNYDHVVTVGSSGSSSSTLSYFSGWDSHVDVHAKGENILSASFLNDRDVYRLSGTSMATPHIAGVFAKLWEIYPEKSSEQLKNVLLSKCVQELPVSHLPNHIWCKKASNTCPGYITPVQLDVERAGCMTGVIVVCPDGMTTCSEADIIGEYGSGLVVEMVGSTPSSGGISVASNIQKWRIVGETATSIGVAKIDTTLAPTKAPLCEGCTYAPTAAPTAAPASSIGVIIGGIIGGIFVLGGLSYCVRAKSPRAQGYTKV